MEEDLLNAIKFMTGRIYIMLGFMLISQSFFVKNPKSRKPTLFHAFLNVSLADPSFFKQFDFIFVYDLKLVLESENILRRKVLILY